MKTIEIAQMYPDGGDRNTSVTLNGKIPDFNPTTTPDFTIFAITMESAGKSYHLSASSVRYDLGSRMLIITIPLSSVSTDANAGNYNFLGTLNGPDDDGKGTTTYQFRSELFLFTTHAKAPTITTMTFNGKSFSYDLTS